MTLFDERYRAMSSRDARFDGQFITGVHSTGIYCRPSCPAMTPHAKNVVFYRTAAAAHEAGLRACKRCQPDAVPGSPDWNLHDDLASRAMRLISDGVVEREGVPGLASRLGYTSRHLTRVLTAELGAGPLALARANRAQNARVLLTTTALPIADVAFAAGFASIRQFNETMHAVYESTPTALRARRRVASNSPADVAAPGLVTVTLPARAPFDGPGLMRYFASHAITGVETGDDTTFARSLRLPGGVAQVEVSLAGDAAVRVSARLGNVKDLGPLVARVRRMFDLDADSVAIDGALSEDPTLAPLVSRTPGIRLPGAADPYETLVRTMIGQQVSIKAARTVLGRLSAELAEAPGLFPTPQQFAERGAEVLRGPATRVSAILGIAEAIASGELVLDVGLPVHELVERLVAYPGVGPWTAGYVAIRVLGTPDVLLSSDLVMLAQAKKLGLPATSVSLARHGERWAPWRSYAGMHLWRSSTIAG
jgi:AraC family transcriptional regulator, regulatory protein of adaptative response / DNA-3-methyladenine glycosylase II